MIAKKKYLLATVFLAFCAMLASVFAFGMKNAEAATELNITSVGAAIRYKAGETDTTGDGIRFTFAVNKAEADEVLGAGLANVTQASILFMPTELVPEGGLKPDTADVAKRDLLPEDVKVNGENYNVTAYMWGIPATAYNREITSVTYIKLNDGTEIYSEVDSASIAWVAWNAYNAAGTTESQKASLDTYLTADYTVTYYDEDGTTVLGTEKITRYGDAAVSAPEATKDSSAEYNFVFENWVTEKDGETVADLGFVKDNMNVYARYKAVAKGYTVTFNAAGGSGTMEDQTFTMTEEKALSANAFTKTYYTFAGWSYNGETYTDNQVVSALSANDGDVLEFVAVWEEEGSRVRSVFDVPATNNSLAKRVDSGTAACFNVVKQGFSGTTTGGLTLEYEQLNAIQPGDTLTISITMAVEKSGGFMDNWSVGFWGVADSRTLANRLAFVRSGDSVQGYANPGASIKVQNSYARSYAFSITFDKYATAKIAAQGGLQYKVYETGGTAATIIYGISVNRYLPENPTENFEGDSFAYGVVGAVNGENYGPSTIAVGREGETKLYFEGSSTDNNGYLIVRSDVLNALRAGDGLALDVYFVGTDANFYNFNTGAFEDVSVEVYARSEDQTYNESNLVYTANIKELEWYYTTWRTLNITLSEEQAAAIQAGGGIAIRIKFNNPADSNNLWYRLFIDNLTLILSDNETTNIASTAENVETAIAADVAARFVGFYTKVNSVEESEGKYVASVTIAKDGMYDRTFNITYTLAQ